MTGWGRLPSHFVNVLSSFQHKELSDLARFAAEQPDCVESVGIGGVGWSVQCYAICRGAAAAASWREGCRCPAAPRYTETANIASQHLNRTINLLGKHFCGPEDVRRDAAAVG